MQNTRHYMFSHSLNVNSCKWNFTYYSGLLIRTTNLYCENMICLNLNHALPGLGGMALLISSTNGKLSLKFRSVFLYFYSHKIVGINLPRKTWLCVNYFCMWYCCETLTPIYQSICCYQPEECFLNKHHCENSEPLIYIFSYKKLLILIEEHLRKPLNVLITSNVILFILTDKFNFYSLWTFPNVWTSSPMKQWVFLGVVWG